MVFCNWQTFTHQYGSVHMMMHCTSISLGGIETKRTYSSHVFFHAQFIVLNGVYRNEGAINRLPDQSQPVVRVSENEWQHTIEPRCCAEVQYAHTTTQEMFMTNGGVLHSNSEFRHIVNKKPEQCSTHGHTQSVCMCASLFACPSMCEQVNRFALLLASKSNVFGWRFGWSDLRHCICNHACYMCVTLDR